MSLLDDEEILLNDECWMNHMAQTRAYNLSYGFWYKKILEPSIDGLKKGKCRLNTYVIHPNFYEFGEHINKVCLVHNISKSVIDCSGLNDVSDSALFIQRINSEGLIILLNPSLLPKDGFYENIKNILFHSWKNDIIDVERLLKENQAEKYIIKNGNKSLKRGNFGLIYLDSVDNKNINFHTKSNTLVYGDFFIPSDNFMFINKCYEDGIINMKDLVDCGIKLL